MPDNDDSLQKYSNGDESGDVYEFRRFEARGKLPLKTKLVIGAMLLGGMALGTLLFLFFLTLFIYVGIPVLAVLSLWGAYRYWRWKRSWRRFSQR
ncbi:MAG: hypothetical protein PHN49_03965 [Candidatus Omnitrophica bacterium]|nr:hypothetical protein [Candidatus Omnitrophota bacterium]MDD5670776.1 hypothetical protein [Candidatus Omnitrophota bacterium]